MLSGGEQQRVAVARALVMQPTVLLADEPTGDLDEQTAESLHGLLRDMHRTYGLTSIIATHNPRLAAPAIAYFGWRAAAWSLLTNMGAGLQTRRRPSGLTTRRHTVLNQLLHTRFTSVAREFSGRPG
jgi:predicted ABC-type transport system involved in lysophospholipase L1 biosynthesis ATPase subunit